MTAEPAGYTLIPREFLIGCGSNTQQICSTVPPSPAIAAALRRFGAVFHCLKSTNRCDSASQIPSHSRPVRTGAAGFSWHVQRGSMLQPRCQRTPSVLNSGGKTRMGTQSGPPEPQYPLPVRIWRGLRDPLGFLTDLEAQLGDIVTLRAGRTYAVFHPDHVKHVLQDNHMNYRKGNRYRKTLAPLMGNGLFTSEGDFWLRQRRIAQGAFQRAHLPSLAEPILDCVAGVAEKWENKSRKGEPVALREELTELTLRIALKNLFSTDADAEMPSLIDAVFGVNDAIKLGAAFVPVHLPAWVPTPGRRRFARSLRTIDDFVSKVISRRRRAATSGSDLVGLLINARDPETGEQMSELQLRDELVTMLNAGHDTVTDSIAWTLVLLAQHRDAVERLRTEMAGVRGAGCLSAEVLGRMEFLERVFRESMRLYPPAWGFARTAIGETSVNKNTLEC